MSWVPNVRFFLQKWKQISYIGAAAQALRCVLELSLGFGICEAIFEVGRR